MLPVIRSNNNNNKGNNSQQRLGPDSYAVLYSNGGITERFTSRKRNAIYSTRRRPGKQKSRAVDRNSSLSRVVSTAHANDLHDRRSSPLSSSAHRSFAIKLNDCVIIQRSCSRGSESESSSDDITVGLTRSLHSTAAQYRAHCY